MSDLLLLLQTRYSDYFAYDSSEETVVYPDETAHDGEKSVISRQIYVCVITCG